jgi:hypothetical protein
MMSRNSQALQCRCTRRVIVVLLADHAGRPGATSNRAGDRRVDAERRDTRSTSVASRWPNVVAGDGSVRSSAGTYTAWIDDRAGLGRRDALLQAAHFGERRLVADRGGHPSEQRGHFGARERVAVDVVDEEQDVAAFVAEALGHRQPSQRDAQSVARRLVHLAEHHRDLRLPGRPGG